MFGLVYDQPLSYLFTDPAILALMAGMSGVWDDAGVSLAVLPSLHPDDAGTSVLSAAGVDGFVSICDVADDSRVAALVARRLPFVTVDAGESSGRCRVGIDDRRASADATRHLIDLGHRRLAVVVLPRGQGALAGQASAVHPRPERFTVSGARLAGIRDAVEAGVVAMSDELAAGVLDAAAERGVEVPGQLSVVGFDDTPTATSVSPALTTVHQPLAAKGQTAARLLLEGAPATVIRLPTELRVRASTGPAPGS